jgi:lysylphosphatidylglycerol synthetase-like protein (DUF2156 family)
MVINVRHVAKVRERTSSARAGASLITKLERVSRERRATIGGADSLGAHARLAARFGRTGIAPTIATKSLTVVELGGGFGAAAYVRHGRWAVTSGDVVAPEELADSALSEYLDVLSRRGLRPVFVAISDPQPFRRRAFATSRIREEAVVDLAAFDLTDPRRAELRHAVERERGARLSVRHHEQTHQQHADDVTDFWDVVDRNGTALASCTWRPYLGNSARVLDDVWCGRDGPKRYLLAKCLEHYRDAGLIQASLGRAPLEQGLLTDWAYPRRTLLKYQQQFDPRWERRWLAVPAGWQRPFARAAIRGASESIATP